MRHALPVALLTIIGLVSLIAYGVNDPYFQQLRYVRELPHATVEAPIEGPAIYKGRLLGPESRIAPSTRKPAAMTFWWVITGGSKSRKRVCFERAVNEVRLASGDVSIPIRALDAGDLSLVSDRRDSDWNHNLVVDTGPLAEYGGSTLPKHASHCSGTSPSYTEVVVPQGTEVEVVACYSGNALRDCGLRPISALVSVPDEITHRRRRAERSYLGFVVVAGLCVPIIGILFITAINAYRRTSRPVRPS